MTNEATLVLQHPPQAAKLARSLVLLAFSALILACGASHLQKPNTNRVFSGQPHLMLWAWEMPTDLRFIDIHKTGIAFLAGTIRLQDDSLLAKPRFQSLRFPAGCYKMAVVRIDLSRIHKPTFSQTQGHELSTVILRLAASQRVNSLQIDFDAGQNQRDFYYNLLCDLRKMLPSDMPLSITALSSWCLKDTWISKMPCDEVVPMFFCMGEARREAIDLLSGGWGLARMPMQESLGLSVAEPDVVRILGSLSEHVYLFSPKGWKNQRSIKWVKDFEAGGNAWKFNCW